MRRIVACILLFLSFLSVVSPVAVADNRDVTVYIASGSKSAYRYHAKSSCSSLSRSTVGELTLEQAAMRGYTPCTKCHPPAPDFEVKATPRPVSESGGSTSTHSITTTRTNIETDSWEMPRFYLHIGGAVALVTIPIWAKKKKKEMARKEKERLEKAEWENKKRSYENIFKNKSTLELSGAPSDCYVGEDGLPACRHGKEKWGDRFTVYMTSSGQCYHKISCRVALGNFVSPVNAYHAKKGFYRYNGSHDYCPCSYCKPELPDMAWYEKYQEIQKIRKRFDIPEPCEEKKEN